MGLSGEHEFVGVADLGGAGSLVVGDEFVAGGEDGDGGGASDWGGSDAEFGQGGDVLGVESGAGGDEGLSCAFVVALEDDVEIFADWEVREGDEIGGLVVIRLFDRDDEVCAGRDDGSGHDAGGFVGRCERGAEVAGCDALGDAEGAGARGVSD